MGGKKTTIESPRVGAFKINAATYGLPVAAVFGTTRVAGNLIDYFDFTAIQHRSSSGGKGGGGVTNITYTYRVTTLIGLCEGPVSGVGKVWRNKDILPDAAAAGFTVFAGARGQEPWSYVTGKYPERALPYSNLCYVAGVLELGDQASMASYNFEIKGRLLADGTDANPADVIREVLNDVGIGDAYIDLESLGNYRAFCHASGLLVSLSLTDAEKAVNILSDICLATNTSYFWSQNKLKFVPRGDEEISKGGYTYHPNIAPLYDLTDDDFGEQGDGALVSFERVDRSEAYNHVTIEFLNRDNDYNQEQAEFKIQSDINRRGLKSMSSKSLYCLHTKERAAYAAAAIAHQSMYARTRYKFSLDWSKCLLEPGDIVTLTTNAGLTLNRKVVEITEVEEEDDGTLNFVALEKNIAGAPPLYQSQEGERVTLNTDQEPSDTKAPFVYHHPTTDRIIGIAVCGTEPGRWGGCEIWASADGDTYEYLGDANTPARYGVLLTDLPESETTVDVELYDKGLQLLPASAETADADGSLLLIDGEWMAYEGAELIGAGRYRLSNLRRARAGTSVAAHEAGDYFVRYDPAGYKYSYYDKDIGHALYIKLPAKNIFGLHAQEMDSLPAYQYTISRAGQTMTERRTVELETGEWTAFSFENSFSAAPGLFWVDALDFGAAAYFRNLTAEGFEARLLDIVTGLPTAGSLMYEAQGR